MAEPLFNLKLSDIWNDPITQVLRTGAKWAIKGMMSADTKESIKSTETPEFLELLNEATGGNSEAQCALGVYYAEKQDIKKAEYWLGKSVAQGNEYAEAVLEFLQGE